MLELGEVGVDLVVAFEFVFVFLVDEEFDVTFSCYFHSVKVDEFHVGVSVGRAGGDEWVVRVYCEEDVS